MADQSASLNQLFRQRIAGYMKAILIFNSCKLAASIGALVSAVFIRQNFPILPAFYYVLPLVGASVTFIASAAVVYMFISDERKEHFISNVILYRIGIIVCQIPLAVGFGVNIYLVSNFPYSYIPSIVFLVFSGLIIFFLGIGSSVCMRRVYAIKWLMLINSARNTVPASANQYPPGYGFSTP
ncbi:hypothetical protein TrispH2_004456, partial [Trichoplax sp. H2]